MTTNSASHPLLVANSYLAIALNNLQQQLEIMQTTETYAQFRNNWQDISAKFESYKAYLSEQLPKELKQRDFVNATIKSVEGMEKEVRHFFNDFKSSKIPELELQLAHLRCQLAELENHSLIQKFVRNEVILSSRSKLQWWRKITHVGLGMLFLYIFVYSGLPEWAKWIPGAGFLLWGFGLETLRHLNPKVNDWVCEKFRPIMRESEKTRINSGVFYMAAMLFVYLIFPVPVIIQTMFFIAIGDTVAGVVGVFYGKTKLKTHVSLEGTAACFLVCYILAAITARFLVSNPLTGLNLFAYSVLSGMIGAYSETALKKLDDNLVMPMISAPLIYILMKLFLII